MKNCCFVIPYFGRFPNYFQLFLNSCKYNPDFNWLIFSDDTSTYDFPPNVRLVRMTFEELKKHIQSFFDFEIVLPSPYKLCDYKPSYGYVFHEYLKDFRFWGYCDIDVIMGNLRRYLTSQLFETYDKIFCLGHMTLFKNTEENNRLFMSEFNGHMLYKRAFTTENIVTFDEEWRDENNINQMFLSEGKNVFMEDYSMNPSILYNNFIRVKYIGNVESADSHGYKTECPKKALYVWDKGHIYRCFFEGKQFRKEEYIYMHFQMRKMKVDKRVTTLDQFKIIPDKFLPLEVEEVTEDNFRHIKKSGLCLNVQRLHLQRLKKKIKNLFNHA